MTQTERRTEVSGCVLQMGRGQRRQWPIDLTDNLSVFPHFIFLVFSNFQFSPDTASAEHPPDPGQEGGGWTEDQGADKRRGLLEKISFLNNYANCVRSVCMKTN